MTFFFSCLTLSLQYRTNFTRGLYDLSKNLFHFPIAYYSMQCFLCLAKENSNMTSLFQLMPHINQQNWPFNSPVYYKLNILKITCTNITNDNSTCLVRKRSHRPSIAPRVIKVQIQFIILSAKTPKKIVPNGLVNHLRLVWFSSRTLSQS